MDRNRFTNHNIAMKKCRMLGNIGLFRVEDVKVTVVAIFDKLYASKQDLRIIEFV